MASIEELQFLSEIVETKDFEIVSKNQLTSDHFPIFEDVFNFVTDFYKVNRSVPTAETLLNKFQEFELVEREHVPSVVQALKEDYLHRKIKPVLVDAANMVADKRTTDALQLLKMQSNNILKLSGTSTKGYSYVHNAATRKENYLKIHGRSEEDIIGFTTGFAPLDKATNGIIGGPDADEADYFLVFAPSNMGKSLISSFMLQAAWNSTTDWDYPAYFALEQQATEIARIWDNVLGGVSSLALQRGTLTPEAKDRYIHFLDILQSKQKDMVIYDLKANGGRPYTVRDINRIIESEGHTRFTLDQLSKVQLSSSFGSRYDLREKLFEISGDVRSMILDTKIPGFVLAQATRDVARRLKRSDESSDEVVQGEDVGEAYAIFQDASKGISIHKVDDNTFKLTVVKNRGNSSGQNFLARYNWDTGLVTTLDSTSPESFF